jgi:NADH-quinone oxidoreductase subunit J
MSAMQIVFLVIAVVTILTSLLAVNVKRMMHAALWLVACLLGVACLFALLESRFFTVIQVMVYIGAIAILIIYAVMLTRNMMDDPGPQRTKGSVAAGLVCVLLFVLLVVTISSWPGFNTATRQVASGGEDIVAFGKALVDPQGFLIPFEVASILLVAAMVGAIYIAAERKGK